MILLFLIAFLCSCGKDSSCLKGTGKQITEVRELSVNISEIMLRDNVDLILTQDSVVSLKVKGGENLLPYVKTNIEGNSIEITNNNKCNFLRSYNKSITVYLSTPDINFIDYTGHGDISTTNTFVLDELLFDTKNGTGSVDMSLDIEHFELKSNTGPTDFKMRGKADYLFIFANGNGDFNLEDLLISSCHVSNSGTGDVVVNVKDDLRIELRSLGDVVYYGNPVVDVTINTGKGKIVKR